jgi:hypothetical protein
VESNGQRRENKKFEKVKSLIPPGNEILDLVAADMNQDGFTDFALVLRNENENTNGDELRPLLIVAGNKNGEFKLLQRNDSVVLCKNCGGVFGDPFQSITFTDGLLAVEHNVGNNLRWSRNISFRFDQDLQEFILNDDASYSYQRASSSKQVTTTGKKEEDGKRLFRDFSFTKYR